MCRELFLRGANAEVGREPFEDGFDLQLTRYDERGWRPNLLHDRDGALT